MAVLRGRYKFYPYPYGQSPFFEWAVAKIASVVLFIVAMAVMGIVSLAVDAVFGPSRAQTVTDGDTIKLHGTIWRLWGIDAPETRQACAGGWPAGIEATATMRRLIEGRVVVCEFRGHDRYRRSIGLCRADGVDLGAEMVSAGMAWAFTRYSGDYVEQEKAAITARIGVHAHNCEKPWDWRAQRR